MCATPYTASRVYNTSKTITSSYTLLVSHGTYSRSSKVPPGLSKGSVVHGTGEDGSSAINGAACSANFPATSKFRSSRSNRGAYDRDNVGRSELLRRSVGSAAGEVQHPYHRVHDAMTTEQLHDAPNGGLVTVIAEAAPRHRALHYHSDGL
eukprot:RCo043954